LLRYNVWMDVLQDQLARVRSSGGVFAQSVARPPWGIDLPGTIQLTVHVVLKGRAYVWADDSSSAHELVPGALALVPGGQVHHLAHSSDAVCVPHERFLEEQAAGDPPDQQDASIFMCGAYQFSGDVGKGLLRTLEPILVLRTTPHDSLHQIIMLLSRELAQPGPGQQTVLDRLLDVLVVYGLRASLEQSLTPPNWFTAANDPRLGAALHAIHSQPEIGWTVPDLATVSRMSRPTFARNFEQALGESPMRYLTEWRMTLARDYLQVGELSLTEIARRVGYSSTNAFAAAFQRRHGQPPGEWRSARPAPCPATVR
jgi:AraC-like DNA-binding protein